MAKRMLIDSTHAEETRVVVLDGNRLEDFDVETSTKHQLKGNIYLAKVVRVEPSLQAAFVEYGGNRHGFLAFGEIHPDYYQIPVADRKRLIEAQEAEAREDEERAERGEPEIDADAEIEAEPEPEAEPDTGEADDRTTDAAPQEAPHEPPGEHDFTRDEAEARAQASNVDVLAESGSGGSPERPAAAPDPDHQPALEPAEEIEPLDSPAPAGAEPLPLVVTPDEAAKLLPPDSDGPGSDMAPETGAFAPGETATEAAADMRALALDAAVERVSAELGTDAGASEDELHEMVHDAPPPEHIGGEHDTEEHPARRSTPRFLRHYKIQEVIRRRQILLVQVVKEERGSKGAALTTYISLAGRFSVLMPNSPRGGGISRKITSAADRKRLKEVTAELDLPRGMGLIVRTAGANRPKPEILRDCEYLLNQWDQIRDLTMKSVAPALIYEEANLIKRAIRDVYSRDVDDILVDGEQGWRAARDFMRMLMPTHARKVQLWRDPQPLFAKAQVEPMLEAMLAPTVQLRSGGYLVINQTEALVAIDVNSGRSTRERGIEETALRTNLEAAEEVARQLRLRDLAGLIVIDFIDMENRRNIGAVERRLKEALKSDRARIQVGSISHFGLLEMSRQRLRPSLTETNFSICAHCSGTGLVRSTESAALHTLRAIEEEGGKRKAAEIVVHCPSSVALYILNHKRARLSEVEVRHQMAVTFVADETLMPPALRIERVRPQLAAEMPLPVQQLAPPEPFDDPDELDVDAEEAEEIEAEANGEAREDRDQRRGRRRRRRRGRREDMAAGETGAVEDVGEADAPAASDDDAEMGAESGDIGSEGEGEEGGEGALAEADAEGGDAEGREERERRRRGRRGGRRRRRGENGAPAPAGENGEGDEEPAPAAPIPAYFGPTPADPFAGATAFDIFDAIEMAEEERVSGVRAPAAPVSVLHAELHSEPSEESPPVLAAALRVEPAPAVSDQASAAETPAVEPVESLVVPPAVAAEPAEPEPEPGPIQGPAIQPVVIGGEPPVERRRGWWRR